MHVHATYFSQWIWTWVGCLHIMLTNKGASGDDDDDDDDDDDSPK